jgi:uncharacterized protein YjbJ (UPF0337 family)
MQATKTPETQQLEGSWQQFKGKIQETWGDLTDDELDQFKGKWNQLAGKIKESTGEDREAIREKIDRLAAEAKFRI